MSGRMARQQRRERETTLYVRCKERTKRSFASFCADNGWDYEEGLLELLKLAQEKVVWG